jgi:hypothetical protein
MPNKRKNAKNPVITHGLYANWQKWQIDGRTAAGKAIRRAREALATIFPKGPDVAANIIIDRVTFKALKASIYEALSINGANLGKEAEYLAITNSLRSDIRLLCQLAESQGFIGQAPELGEYLASIRQAGKTFCVDVKDSDPGEEE